MTYVVGVDGGGTSTRAVVLDERGLELGRAEAGAAVVTARAPEVACEAVVDAVRAAVERACVELPAAGLWAGLSGAGRDRGRRAVTTLLEGSGLAKHVWVGSDVGAAFHAAFPEGPGILLIAGTGSIAWARTPEGEIGRAGGWGRHLGDEGSGYAIGLGALRALARAEDGRDGATVMRDDVLRALALSDATDLIPWSESASKAEVAGLVPIVARAAASGDPAASEIMDEAVRELAHHVVAVLDRMGPWPGPPPLFLWGGLVGEQGPLRDALAREVASLDVELKTGRIDPALGAARLALARLRGGRG